MVHPTETFYGIGTALSAGDAGVDRVRVAKRAPGGRPYLLLAADTEMAFTLWTEASPQARELAERAWPGPLTLVGPARDGLPGSLLGSLAGAASVSVRVPGLASARALSKSLGEPFVSTSANRSGQPPPTSFDEVDLEALAPDLALNGGTCPGGEPSTLVSVVGERLEVLREGAWKGVLA